MQFIIVISMIISILIAFFAVQNAGVVVVNLLWYKVSMSQAVIILCSALFGVLIMLPFDIARTIKYKLKLMDLSGENKRLKEELKKCDSEKEKTVQEILPAVDDQSKVDEQQQ
ncbi:MAG TPA: LapA family protein [Clostridia bacterium]|nr:LapA family protein [Clostridia bacterium]